MVSHIWIKLYTFNMYSLLYFSYTSMKLGKKEEKKLVPL